jgi:DMSO/TMAO reductase YedYZ heme-binding membrane subunit
MKLSGRAYVVLFVLAAAGILVVTDQIVPPISPYQAQMRVWLAARATGVTALVLLAAQVVLGILLSHPDQNRWKQSKRMFPWHESMSVFVAAFLAVHIATIVVDPYAGVGIGGALIPGLSTYRSVPVALGVVALYSLLITALTARYTRLLPAGLWIKVHRLSLVVLGLAWAHGVLAGTDVTALAPVYWGVAFSVLGAAVYRYWIVRERVRRHASAAALSAVPVPTEEPHVEPRPAP